MNGNDPILREETNLRELFRRMSKSADGFSTQDVINASANILVNALRQVYGTRQSALGAFDMITTKSKERLADCYDDAGRKRGVYPYDQHIVIPKMNFRR